MGTDLVYEKFISKVADNRGVTKEEIDDIARGKVWIGSKALEIGLIDEIAGIDRAIELAAELAEINDEELGVKRAINYNKEDFLDVIKSIGGVHLILDMVGGAYIAKNINALVDDGRLVQIAFLNGARVEINFAQIMTRRLTFTGSTLRPQSDLSKTQIASELLEKIWPLLGAGRLNPIIDSVFELEDVGSAHLLMESSKHIGKILLKVE